MYGMWWKNEREIIMADKKNWIKSAITIPDFI
jgi:hypothetical protein